MASGMITHPGLQAAFEMILDEPGDSDTFEIEAGGSAMRGGLEFTCDSAYPCTVTISNSVGTIVASWESQQLPDDADGFMMASVTVPLPPPDPMDTFARLNDPSADALRLLVAPAADPLAPVLTATELTGMDIGGAGVLNADDAGLRSLFDPNGPAFGASPGDAAAAPGATPTLTGGSTLTGARDGFEGGDIADAPTGWKMTTLFADWGDTVGTGDGGFETGAIVVKNFEPGGTAKEWDADLAGMFANGGAEYNLTVDSDTTTGNDSVAFTVDATNAAPPMSNVDAGAAGSGVLETTIGSADDAAIKRAVGTYRGVMGSYTCGTVDCVMTRTSGGDAFTLGAGSWQFRPDPGAMVQVPDQDWLVYGAWMTTPDGGTGTHRIGTLFNGFDPYAGANSVFTVADDNALHGTASYTGGAAGVYVDGTESGLFTASASLTANFDVDGDGIGDDDDYTIRGQIDDFRGTDGVFLGSDTEDMPNDPTQGGENDWVVTLGQVDLTGITAGTIPSTATAGSADGAPWAGTWNGQLFGAGDTATDGVAPTGVAGQFSAATAPAGDPLARTTGVVGSFGATSATSE